MRQETKETIRPIADAFARFFPDASADLLVAWGQSKDTAIRREALVFSNLLLRGKPRAISARLPGAGSASGISDDMVLRYMYVFGVWEPIVSSHLKGGLWPGSVFVDVGANRGYYSALAADTLGEGGTVLAVEALPDFARSLRETAAASKSACTIQVAECALSDSVGRSDFYLPHAGNQGVGSLINTSSAPRRTISVETTTLDNLLIAKGIDPWRVSAVKIDVEGVELQVLRGASSALRNMPPGSRVFVEMGSPLIFHQVTSLLVEAGFVPKRLPNEYAPRWYAANRRNHLVEGGIGSDSKYPQDFCFTKAYWEDRRRYRPANMPMA